MEDIPLQCSSNLLKKVAMWLRVQPCLDWSQKETLLKKRDKWLKTLCADISKACAKMG